MGTAKIEKLAGGVAQHLDHEATADRFAAMHWHGSNTAIRMAEQVVAERSETKNDRLSDAILQLAEIRPAG